LRLIMGSHLHLLPYVPIIDETRNAVVLCQ